jgi:hypothetical protein
MPKKLKRNDLFNIFKGLFLYYRQMKNKFVFFGLLLIAFTSCGDGLRQKKKANIMEEEPILFNMSQMFTDNELNVSFPIWFNDTIIKKHRIKSIKRYIYSGIDKENKEGTLKELKTYNFDDKGEILSVEINQYYENMLVAELSFNYLGIKDEYGFANVVPEKVENSNGQDDNNHYAIYEKNLYGNKFLVYVNSEDGTYLFYMLNKKDWGGVTIDVDLNPTPNDIIVLGSPKTPTKKYQVRNTVNEFNIREATYNKKGVISKMEFEKYPFSFHRTFSYDKKGKNIGFVDSTYSGSQFLTKRVSTFKFENSDMPKEILHEHFAEDEVKGNIEKEFFKFEFFEN